MRWSVCVGYGCVFGIDSLLKGYFFEKLDYNVKVYGEVVGL